jgi:hypothetical protein
VGAGVRGGRVTRERDMFVLNPGGGEYVFIAECACAVSVSCQLSEVGALLSVFISSVFFVGWFFPFYFPAK